MLFYKIKYISGDRGQGGAGGGRVGGCCYFMVLDWIISLSGGKKKRKKRVDFLHASETVSRCPPTPPFRGDSVELLALVQSAFPRVSHGHLFPLPKDVIDNGNEYTCTSTLLCLSVCLSVCLLIVVYMYVYEINLFPMFLHICRNSVKLH